MKNRPNTGRAVSNGMIRFTSAKQITLFSPDHEGCNRKWAFEYVFGKKLEKTGSLTSGIEKAEKLEHYLKTGEDVLPPVLQEAKKFFPVPGTDLEVEMPLGNIERAVQLRDELIRNPHREDLKALLQQAAGLTACGIPLDGAADYRHCRGQFIDENGDLYSEHSSTRVVEVGDLKTTSRIWTTKIKSGPNAGKILPGYAKTNAQVCMEPQMLSYARHAVDKYRDWGLTHVRLSHVYASTGTKGATKRTGLISVQQILDRYYEKVEKTVGQMIQVATAPKIEDVQPTTTSCDAYTHVAPDGSTQKGCGHKYYCPLATSVAVQHLLGHYKESAMSLFDTLPPSALSPAAPVTASPAIDTNAERAAIEAEKAKLRAEDANISVKLKGGTCAVCGNPSTRYMNSASGNHFLCDGCPPPAVGAPPPPPAPQTGQSWLRSPMAVSPPDSPPPASLLEAADPLPASALAEVTDPALRQTIVDHAAQHQALAQQQEAAKEAEKMENSVWCRESKSRIKLTMEMALSRKYICSCTKAIGLKPAKLDDGTYEATIPRHKPVNKVPMPTVPIASVDEDEEDDGQLVFPVTTAPPPPPPPAPTTAAPVLVTPPMPPQLHPTNGNGHGNGVHVEKEESVALLKSIDSSLKELIGFFKSKAA